MHIRITKPFAWTLLSVLFIGTQSYSQNPVHTGSLTHGTGGALLSSPSSVYVSGNYAYIASSGSDALEIVDITNPAAPTHKGKLTHGTGGALLSSPSCVFVKGNYAYLVDGNALEIVDVTNPAAPVHKGSLTNGTGGAVLWGAKSVYVSGSYAYIASPNSNALEIVDVSNPAAPVHKGRLLDNVDATTPPLLLSPQSVFVSGSNAYVVDSGYLFEGNPSALEIVDVTNPGTPVHKGSITSFDISALHEAVSGFILGNYAYVAVLGSIADMIPSHLVIIDITDPAAPVHKGTLNEGAGGALISGAASVYVSGNLAYVGSIYSGAIEVVDVFNPATPVHLGNISHGTGGALLQYPGSVYVSGDYIYVVDYINDALEILYHPAPTISSFSPTTVATGATITITGTHLNGATAVSFGGIPATSFNVVSPTTITAVVSGGGPASVTTPFGTVTSSAFTFIPVPTISSFSPAVALTGTTVTITGTDFTGATAVAFGGTAASSFQVVSATSITAVVASGASGNVAITTPGGTGTKADFKYIPSFQNTDPIHVGSLSDGTGGALLANPYSVAVSGNYAYVVGYDPNNFGYLEVIDVTNPSAPVHAGGLVNGAGAYMQIPVSIKISGNYAYITCAVSQNLVVVDISDPASPVQVGDVNVGQDSYSEPHSVFISENKAYVTNGHWMCCSPDELVIFDLTLPTSPTGLSNLEDGEDGALLDSSWPVFVSGNYTYVGSNGHDALEIVDVTNPATPTHKASLTHGTGGAILTDPSSIFVSGNHAYVTSYAGNALEIVDVTNPAAPVHKSSIVDGTNGALLAGPNSVFVSGNYAFVASIDSDALEVVDISDPSAPVHFGSITHGTDGALLDRASSVLVHGSYAYVAGGNSLEILYLPMPVISSISPNPTATGALITITGENFTGATAVSIGGIPVSSFTVVSPTTITAIATGSTSGSVKVETPFGKTSKAGFVFIPIPVATAATAVTQTSFSANWSASTGAIGYFLDVSTAGDFSSFVTGYQNLPVGNLTAYPVNSNLTAGSTFYYRVRAFDNIPVSSSSNSISVITIPPEPVSAVATNIAQTSFDANWATTVGATQYAVDITTDAAFSNHITGSPFSAGNVLTLSINVPSAGTTYYYRIRAANDNGSSGNSGVQSVLTIPPNPVATIATLITPASFSANWSAATMATGYAVDVATDIGFAAPITGSPFAVGNFLTKAITGLAGGTDYYYRVRASNGSGVSGNSNAIQLTTSPALAISQPLETSTKFSVTITGGSGARTVKFYAKGIMAPATAFTEIALTSTTAVYEPAKNASDFDELGLEYYFSASDASVAVPVETAHLFSYVTVDGSSAVPFTSSFDGTTGTYQMFSVPYRLTEKNVANVFASLGGNDKTVWRLFHYQGGKYVEYPDNITSVEVGKGYWFNTKKSAEIKPGAGVVAQANLNAPFTISLEKGWNQIGNPFPFTIDWGMIKILAVNAPAGVNSLFTFSNGYTNTTGFKPWTGGFVFSDNGGTLTLPVNSKCSGCRISSNPFEPELDGPAWQLPITISLEGLEQISAIGMHPEAKESKDRFDEIALPRFIDYLEMHTIHNEFFAPYFSTDVRPSGSNGSWEFTLASNRKEGRAVLSWDPSAMTESTSKLVLLDLQEGTLVDMKANGTYSFDWSEDRRFRILYSRDGEIMPGVTMLGSAYPNPFNGQVTIPVLLDKDQTSIHIQVYDLLGRKVKTISKASVKAGVHELKWDGQHESGNALEGGLYLYQLIGEKGILSAPKRLLKQ